MCSKLAVYTIVEPMRLPIRTLFEILHGSLQALFGDFTRGAELLKVAADRHLRDVKRIRNLLDRDGAMGVQKRLSLN